MAGVSLRRAITLAALVIGLAALIGGVIYDRRTSELDPAELVGPPSNSMPSTRPVTESPPDVPVTFAVLGDSLAAGVGVAPGLGWVDDFKNSMCWTMLNASSEAGTGYTSGIENDPVEPTNFEQRIPEVVEGSPQMVIVQGGGHDVNAPPEQIAVAAESTFRALRASLGLDAKIIAVGPVPSPNDDGPSLAGVAGALATAANPWNVIFVDPVAEGWLSSPLLFSEGGTYPNEAGHAELATRLEASLRQHGIQQSGSCG